LVDDVACTACGCVCDDLRLEVADNRIVRTERACRLAEPWLLAQNGRDVPVAEIEGQPASLDDALDLAAQILRRADAPLIYGLSRSSTAAQRAAVELGDRIGATIDTTASLGHGPAILAVQNVGECTCTLGEIRNRADLVVYWGANPAVSHPRHMERYAVEPRGRFVPLGRRGRTVVVVDIEPTATSEQADLFLQVEPGSDFEILWTLRALVRGQSLRIPRNLGVSEEQLHDLAARLKACRFGAVFIGFGLSRSRMGHRSVEALLRLATELNRYTRFYVRRLRGSANVAGADSVLAWQTGFPFSVSLARDWPRYNPGEFSANDMLQRGDVDACLLVGSYGVRRLSSAARKRLRDLPTIVLDPAVEARDFNPTVLIHTAVYGIHLSGTAYRMDEVPMPLRQVLQSELPSDAQLLELLSQRIGNGSS
jgi:formylmethanofuran dehydrogenase subunit B